MEQKYILSRNEFVSFNLKWTNLIVRKNLKFWEKIKNDDIIIFTNHYDKNTLKVKIKASHVYDNLDTILFKFKDIKLYPHSLSKNNCKQVLKIKLNYYTEAPIKVMEFIILD
jgi:ASC-1-like (ASCH) protein